MKAFGIRVELPLTDEAEAWFGQLQSWLETTPEGVVVSIRQQSAVLGDVVTVHDATAFARTSDGCESTFAGRSVFFYLVQKLGDTLVVLCSRCAKRRGVCRCNERGWELDGTWFYNQLSPGDHRGEDDWVITRDSLRNLKRGELPADSSELRRRRVLSFLDHILR